MILPYFTFRRQSDFRREVRIQIYIVYSGQLTFYCVQDTSTSFVTDPDRGLPHLLREAQNGRVPIPPPRTDDAVDRPLVSSLVCVMCACSYTRQDLEGIWVIFKEIACKGFSVVVWDMGCSMEIVLL